jgi:probable F420-dependent oxidoreductase
MSSDFLSVYASPGNEPNPRATVRQAAEAERLGLASVWVSEKWEGKEAGAICGAMSQVTDRIRIVAGLIKASARHPLAAAGLGATMQRLTGNRFALGIGRSSAEQQKRQGMPVLTEAKLADYAIILRRLWAGEEVSYQGPLGEFPKLTLMQIPETAPDIILGASGPKTLALGGRSFDGVVLHPFLTVDGVRRSAQVVRDAAAAAGRTPSDVKITACVVTAPDYLSESELVEALHVRAVGYLRNPAQAKPLLDFNGWDMGPVEALAGTDIRFLEPRGADATRVREMRLQASKLLPEAWLRDGAVVGDVHTCADRLRAYKAAGVDEILVHGLTSMRLAPVVERLRIL